jgi:hypothetical protein
LRSISDPNILKEKFSELNSKVQWRIYNIAKWEEVFKTEIV